MELVTQLAFAILTGSTCGDACWHAREEVCRCSCGGKNHGILNHGGERPKRTARIDGNLYELVAVIPGPSTGECWKSVFDRTDNERNRIMAERFPNIDTWAYGNYRQEKTLPVVDRKISESQSRWTEVAAIPNANRLVWARPAGARYLIRGADHKAIYNDAL